MLPLNIRIRLVAALCAMLASSTLLGAVVFGMQAEGAARDVPVMALERVTISAPVVN